MRAADGKPGAVVVGGDYPGLAVARSLAARAVPVYVVDHQVCVAQFSKWVRRSFRCPPPKDEADFVEFLIQIAAQAGLKGCVLFPGTDEYVRILSMHRDRLSESYLVTTQAWETVRFLYDKYLTYQLALQQGVPTPDTYRPGSVSELSSMALDFPVVVKPAISRHLSAATKKKAYRANDAHELATILNRVAAIISPAEILVQEFIPGGAKNLYSYFGFFREGRPAAGFAARRPRQHPMEFGRASTFALTADIPELGRWATKLLSGIGYTGLAEVEFMYDPKHARFEFLEVNPRIWGWIALGAFAGVELPYLAWADAVGEETDVGKFREGVKWIRVTTDVPTAALEILRGRLTLADYLRSMRGARDAVFALGDPAPFIADLLLIPYYVINRGY